MGASGACPLYPFMRKLLLQLDTSPNPSVFDRVVAYDGGADEIMSCSHVTEGVRRIVAVIDLARHLGTLT